MAKVTAHSQDVLMRLTSIMKRKAEAIEYLSKRPGKITFEVPDHAMALIGADKKENTCPGHFILWGPTGPMRRSSSASWAR